MQAKRATATRETEDGPTDEQLRLVARHGSGQFVRALATVRLLRRQGREDELSRVLNEREGGA